MTSDPLLPPAPRSTGLLALALAALVGALAFFSPIDRSHSDAGLALLVSRTLLYEGTLELNSSVHDPVVGRDLTNDYRVRRDEDGGYDYYSFGVPLLSLPAVALAEVAGRDLRRADDEARLQNLLSALVCFVLVLLLYRLLVVWVEPPAAWVITAVSCLGSSLVSTLGTALWNSGYQLVFLLGACILLVTRRPAPIWRVLLLLLLAALCRPTSAFFFVAVLAFWLQTAEKAAWRKAAGWGLLGIALALVAVALGMALPLPEYYAPSRLFKVGDPVTGALGILFSPSRGLFVFSPFLLVSVVALARVGRRIWRNPVVHLAGIWIVVHLLAVAFKRQWWGGHSFGPRLLLEIVPAFAILTALAWRELRDRGPRWPWLGSYLGCGLIALAIHSGSGLFNPWAVLWNERPTINLVPEEIFDWRYPQFLATEPGLERRYFEIQESLRLPYPLGGTIDSASRYAAFRGWSPPEGPWRWSREPRAEIALELQDPGRSALVLLELEAGAKGRQRVLLSWNGKAIGELVLEGFDPQRRIVALPPPGLRPGENLLGLELPDAAPSESDPRRLGIALRTLKLRALPGSFDGFDFREQGFFRSGFSVAESAWRWTEGRRARLSFPVVRPATLEEPELVFRLSALGEQRAEVFWDKVSLGWLELEGFDPVELKLPVDPSLLESGRLHDLELHLPTALRPEGDPRRLALAFRSLQLRAWRTSETTRGPPAARSQ